MKEVDEDVYMYIVWVILWDDNGWNIRLEWSRLL